MIWQCDGLMPPVYARAPTEVHPSLWKTRRMLSIGLVGGMSWESSLQYYKLLNAASRSGWAGCTPRGP